MTFPRRTTDRARQILDLCRGEGLHLVTVESCTGGLIAACLTEIAGSSEVFERGFVTYSNEAKQSEVGVPSALLDAHGAVSKPVARAMVEGALALGTAELALATTGIAGPGGGSAEKPVGLVYIAAGRLSSEPVVMRRHFSGGREAVRLATVDAALDLVLTLLLKPRREREDHA